MLEFYIVTTIMALGSYWLRVHYGNKLTGINFMYVLEADKTLKDMILKCNDAIKELEEQSKYENLREESLNLIKEFNEQIDMAEENIKDYRRLRHSIYLKAILCFVPIYNILQGISDAITLVDFYNEYKDKQGEIQS